MYAFPIVQSFMGTNMLKSYAELGTVHRGEPCVEYPGEWLLYYPGLDGKQLEDQYPSFEKALAEGHKVLQALEDLKAEYNPRSISICWKCSDNDPRVGKVWFTGFYQHGKFNQFGSYVT